jgi:hypothetical protein
MHLEYAPARMTLGGSHDYATFSEQQNSQLAVAGHYTLLSASIPTFSTSPGISIHFLLMWWLLDNPHLLYQEKAWPHNSVVMVCFGNTEKDRSLLESSCPMSGRYFGTRYTRALASMVTVKVVHRYVTKS